MIEKVKELAISTGEYLKSEQAMLLKQDVELKGTRNYVTYIDKEAESQLIEGLQKILPESAFLAEEETVALEEKEYTWIIDPLDGTSNFVHGDSPYSVSIALRRGKEMVLGVVFDPVANYLFSAITGGSAFLNGEKIAVSKHPTLKNAYIGFGIPYSVNEQDGQILQNALYQFQNASFRIKGSAALEICYVAAGISDAYFHSGLSPWDVAAGSFILERAGGQCTDFSRGNNYIFGKELVASNSIIHDEIMQYIIHK